MHDLIKAIVDSEILKVKRQLARVIKENEELKRRLDE